MTIKRFQGSCHGASGLAGVLVLAAMAIVPACSPDPDHSADTGLPRLLVGTSKTTPRVEGDWRVTTGVTVNGCGSAVLPLVNSFVVRIDQAGSTLSAIVFDHCGTELAEAAGTADFNQIVKLEFKQSVAVGTNCTLELAHKWTGTLQPNLQKIVGGRTLTVHGEGGCGSGLPCNISGPFSAERCSRGVCTFDVCTP